MSKIAIGHLNKAEIVAALYNASKPQGMRFIHYNPSNMSHQEAEQYVSWGYIDYLKGRIMKIDISGNVLDTWGYNRDNGEGAAERIISKLDGESGS